MASGDRPQPLNIKLKNHGWRPRKQNNNKYNYDSSKAHHFNKQIWVRGRKNTSLNKLQNNNFFESKPANLNPKQHWSHKNARKSWRLYRTNYRFTKNIDKTNKNIIKKKWLVEIKKFMGSPRFYNAINNSSRQKATSSHVKKQYFYQPYVKKRYFLRWITYKKNHQNTSLLLKWHQYRLKYKAVFIFYRWLQTHGRWLPKLPKGSLDINISSKKIIIKSWKPLQLLLNKWLKYTKKPSWKILTKPIRKFSLILRKNSWRKLPYSKSNYDIKYQPTGAIYLCNLYVPSSSFLSKYSNFYQKVSNKIPSNFKKISKKSHFELLLKIRLAPIKIKKFFSVVEGRAKPSSLLPIISRWNPSYRSTPKGYRTHHRWWLSIGVRNQITKGYKLTKRQTEFKTALKLRSVYQNMVRNHPLFLDFWTIPIQKRPPKGPRRSKKSLTKTNFLMQDLIRQHLLNETWVSEKVYQRNYLHWLSNVECFIGNIFLRCNLSINIYFTQYMFRRESFMINKATCRTAAVLMKKWDIFTIVTDLRWFFNKLLYLRFRFKDYIFIKNISMVSRRSYKKAFIYLNNPTYIEMNYRLFCGILIRDHLNINDLTQPFFGAASEHRAKRVRKYY